jgi:dipeptidyl aminopeptidase/acylaminoacyl peptidase
MGKQVDYILLEDEGHGIGKPANQEILYPRIADFFDQAFID